MGENLAVEGRMSVRTPMQWDDGRNAGFSTAQPSKLRRPIPEGQFSPLATNVVAAESEPDSLLRWMQRAIHRRRQTPEIGWGRWSVIDVGEDPVLVHRCDWDGRSFVAVHNFGAEPLKVRVPLDTDGDVVIRDLLDRDERPRTVSDGVLDLTLEGYDHRWLRLEPDGR